VQYVPRETLPVPIDVLAMLIPTAPGIFGLVKLNPMGATWSEIRPELLNMAALLLLYGGAARRGVAGGARASPGGSRGVNVGARGLVAAVPLCPLGQLGET
jgi:hypothetical protein